MTNASTPEPDRLARVLEALADPVCRTVVAELDEPRTGPELTSRCETSSSTLYRKLEVLTACGLVETRIEIEPDLSHATRYALAIDELRIDLADVYRLASRDRQRQADASSTPNPHEHAAGTRVESRRRESSTDAPTEPHSRGRGADAPAESHPRGSGADAG